MKQISGFFKLIRTNNLALLLVNLILVNKFLILKNQINHTINYNFLLISLSILLITASGYIINDIYDFEIDKINKNEKIVIDYVISKKTAIYIYLILNIIAVFIGFYLNWNLGIFFVFSVLVLWFYSFKLKKIALLGNLIVSIYTCLPILVLSFYFQNKNKIIYFYCFFAFFTSLIREIVKDIEDIEGDKNNGCLTIPVLLGIKTTKIILIILFSIFVIIYILIINHLAIFPVYIIAIFFIIFFYFFIKLSSAEIQKDFAFLSKILKIMMIIGVLSMIFVKNI